MGWGIKLAALFSLVYMRKILRPLMEEILWIWDAPLASDLQDHQNTTKHTGPNSYQICIKQKQRHFLQCLIILTWSLKASKFAFVTMYLYNWFFNWANKLSKQWNTNSAEFWSVNLDHCEIMYYVLGSRFWQKGRFLFSLCFLSFAFPPRSRSTVLCYITFMMIWLNEEPQKLVQAWAEGKEAERKLLSFSLLNWWD